MNMDTQFVFKQNIYMYNFTLINKKQKLHFQIATKNTINKTILNTNKEIHKVNQKVSQTSNLAGWQ